MAEGGLDFALRDDCEAVRLTAFDAFGKEVEVDFTTDQLSTMIQELGRIRAKMKPEVTRKLDPRPVFKDVSRRTVFHVGRENVVSSEIFLAARHPGFGWCAFPMPNESAFLLANLILKEAQANTPKIIRPKPGAII